MHAELAEIDQQVWANLLSAKADPKNPWRLPVLATVATTGPRVRTIVLRDVNADARALIFHTDKRSPKVNQILSDATVSLVFYDHASGLQVCLAGTASVHTADDLANTQWINTPATSRRAYLGPFAPGERTETACHNLPDNVVGKVPTEDELKPARQNFAVLRVQVLQLDWLKLERDGNARAVFEYSDAGVTATWVAP